MLSNLLKTAAILLALTFVPALSGFSEATAQTSEGESTARKVEKLASKGAKAYGEERYRDAIGYFEQAYDLQPVPNLLYNIGRCHEKLEEYEEAIEHYEEFAVAPEVGSEARRAALKRAESLREIADIDTSDTSGAETESDQTDPEPVTPKEERASSPVPWIVTGAGVGALAVGGAFGLMASSSADEIQSGADFQTRKDAQTRAKTQALVADSLFVVGAVTTGVGIYLLLSADNDESNDKASALVLPYAHDSGAGVGVRLDF
ncbi:MAG: tetratricopeptide repeat protein [Myxococcota bacterium]